jgi:hypothetical protein
VQSATTGVSELTRLRSLAAEFCTTGPVVLAAPADAATVV